MRKAVDERGRDVSATVGKLDGEYLDSFKRGPYQGVARDHFVEVELPANAPKSGPLWLLAQGWLHPTDSSINVALSQGKNAPPRDLSLEVADGHGGWKVVKPHLGFPAGKNKNDSGGFAERVRSGGATTGTIADESGDFLGPHYVGGCAHCRSQGAVEKTLSQRRGFTVPGRVADDAEERVIAGVARTV